MRITTPNDTNQEELDPHYAVVDELTREATRFPGVEIRTLRREVASSLRAHLVHMRTAAVLLGHEHLPIDVLSGSLIDDQSSVASASMFGTWLENDMLRVHLRGR